MATHSSILAWRITWTQEPGGLLSMALQRVGHNWAINSFTFNVNRWKSMTRCMTFFSFKTTHLSLLYTHETFFSPIEREGFMPQLWSDVPLCGWARFWLLWSPSGDPEKLSPKPKGKWRISTLWNLWRPGHTLLDGGLLEGAHMWMLAQLVERGARQKGRPAIVEPRVVALRACFEDILSASVAEKKPVLTPGVGNCFFDLCSIAFVTERVKC